VIAPRLPFSGERTRLRVLSFRLNKKHFGEAPKCARERACAPQISIATTNSSVIAENRRRAASSISKWRSLHMTKETQKALAIIIASLGVLVALLIWANHLRPHP
jgi:hypothetical protein